MTITIDMSPKQEKGENSLIHSADASFWGRRLVRRPMLTQSIPAVTIAVFVLLVVLILVIMIVGYIIVTIRDALGIRQTPLPHAAIITVIAGPILVIYVYDPIRRRLMMRTYISWLKTFDDEHVQPQKRITRIWWFIRRQARRRWIQRAPRGVTQVSLTLLPRYQGENSRTEFPGDIFLE